jgi:hypothetical protein
MAHFTKDLRGFHTQVASNWTKAVAPQARPGRANGKINRSLDIKINHQTAILRLIRNFWAGRGHLPRFGRRA